MSTKLIARDMGIGALQIDPAYQRLISPSQVKWVVANYDEVVFGRLLVAEREGPDGGSFWVVDGQQRLTAARELEMERVPCLVFKSKGRKHEASVFKEINANRALMRPLDIFKASLEAGDPQAVAINAVVHEHGFRITNPSSKSNSGQNYWLYVQSITTLNDLCRRGGTALIADVLCLIKDCWAGEADAVKSLCLTGLGIFLQKAGELVDRKRLVAKLKAHNPSQLLRYVEDTRTIHGGSSRGRLFATALETVYNKGLRRNSPQRLAVFTQSPADAADED